MRSKFREWHKKWVRFLQDLVHTGTGVFWVLGFFWVSFSLLRTKLQVVFKAAWSRQTGWRLSWGRVDQDMDMHRSLRLAAPALMWPPGAVDKTTGLATRHTLSWVSSDKKQKGKQNFYSGYQNRPLKHSIACWLQIMELQKWFLHRNALLGFAANYFLYPFQYKAGRWWPWIVLFGIGGSFLKK